MDCGTDCDTGVMKVRWMLYRCETINNALLSRTVAGRRCSLGILRARNKGSVEGCEIVDNALDAWARGNRYVKGCKTDRSIGKTVCIVQIVHIAVVLGGFRRKGLIGCVDLTDAGMDGGQQEEDSRDEKASKMHSDERKGRRESVKMFAYSRNRLGIWVVFLGKMCSELEQVDERKGGRVMGYLYPGTIGILRRWYRIVE